MRERLFIIGIIIVLFGLGLIVYSRFNIPFFLGKLPGDIVVKRGNATFYFPITSCILLSVIISIVMYFISRR
jgi:hypothetical protein